MTRLFRSKSCGLGRTTTTTTTNNNDDSIFNFAPPSPSLYLTNEEEEEDEDEDEEEEEYNPVMTPFISPEGRRQNQNENENNHENENENNNQFPILTILVAALRKSLITCSVDTNDDMSSSNSSASSMDIGCPTDVRHVSHVTFDRFNGFLGLPVELEPDLPPKVPSASISVFGVSAKSMQCSYDQRGNSVPTILILVQKRLYSEGGLLAEGIFRINAENSQEEYVRSQLNRGIVPRGIDIHCLAGLIKAWFRELPTGVLDSVTPEQVMHCNTEEECTQLVKLLPPTEAALLDWAINLMADVVQFEHQNKMNARNIAMVFAPNMTQMADPLTALIHAVQVMNLLKTLVMKTLREREESATISGTFLSFRESPSNDGNPNLSDSNEVVICERRFDGGAHGGPTMVNLSGSATLNRFESDSEEKFWSCKSKSDGGEEYESISSRSSPGMCKRGSFENGCTGEYESTEVEGILDRLGFRKGVKKLCRHPVLQLSKPAKKNESLGILNT